MSLFDHNKSADLLRLDAPVGHTALSAPAHMHGLGELLYLRTGRGVARIDATSYTLEENSILLVFPNQVHALEAEGAVSFRLLLFQPSWLPELSEVFSGMTLKDPILKNISHYPQIVGLLDMLFEEQNEETPFELAAKRGLVLSLLSKLLHELSPVERGGDSETLRTVMDFCAQNFTRELSLDTLAEQLHMSKFYISHLFGSKLNVRFNDYINTLRVSEACRHLGEGRLSVTEISEAVGFGTIRTFNRAFRKQMGTSPSSYRRTHSGDTRKDR